MTVGCTLATFADHRLAGALPGLVLDQGHLRLDDSFFKCCGGGGLVLGLTSDTTMACAVNARLARVRTLLRAAHRAERQQPGDMSLEPSEERCSDLTFTLRRLGLIARGEARRGIAFASRPTDAPPLSVWTMAMAAAWRFGLSPHVVILGAKDQDLYPKAQGAGPPVIFLGGIRALWDPAHAETVDALVGYAYRSLIPLFLSFELGGKSEGDGAGRAAATGVRNTRRSFGAVISGLRSRPPLAWLMPECRAKLPDVTDGLKGLGLDGPRRSAARSVKLPWEP